MLLVGQEKYINITGMYSYYTQSRLLAYLGVCLITQYGNKGMPKQALMTLLGHKQRIVNHVIVEIC